MVAQGRMAVNEEVLRVLRVHPPKHSVHHLLNAKADGGDDQIRTGDPLVANEVLSQLSYIPTFVSNIRLLAAFWQDKNSTHFSASLLSSIVLNNNHWSMPHFIRSKVYHPSSFFPCKKKTILLSLRDSSS